MIANKIRVIFDYGIAHIKDTPKNKRVLQDIHDCERKIHTLVTDMEGFWKKIEFEEAK